jgi:hypothetical protein
MPGGASAEVEAEITRRERREILRHLENVSRTMTFFRRLAWSLAACMVVNAVVMGVVIHQSMQQVGTLAGVLRGAVSDARPPVAPAGAENSADLNQLQKSLQSLMHELQQR